MRLCCGYWFTRLIVLICVFCSYPALASRVPYFYDNSNLNKAKSAGVLMSGGLQCDLSDNPSVIKKGDPNAKKDDVVVDIDSGYLTINYGARGNYFGSIGQWKYSESVPLNVSSSFRGTMTSALKKAMQSGNCTLANELANQLANGQPQQCGDDTCIGFEDGNGGKCAINSSGLSKCEWDGGSVTGETEDGTPRITISPREGTLDDYAGVNEVDVKKPDNNSNPKDPGNIDNGNSGSSGSGSNNGSGGQGSSNSGSGSGAGSGTTDGNTSGDKGDSSAGSGSGSGGQGSNNDGTGDGSQGDGSGKGTQGSGTGDKGSGSGSGKGDGEGDEDKGGGKKVDYPKLSDFDLEKSIRGLKDRVKDMVPNIVEPSGSCPSLDIAVFGHSQSIRVHCDIFDKHAQAISAAFALIWALLAIRILLSA